MKILHADEYQPRAQRIFEDARALLARRLPAARIEHVGASAIPGAHSKGDVDICVSVAADEFAATLSTLQALGYVIKPDTMRTGQLCMLDWPEAELGLAVQLIERGSEFEFFVAFRDALLADPQLVEAYNRVKHKAAPLGDDDYRKAKSAFIQQVLGTKT
jgi:GrpB-like predicted nucleotidyltransferase (UPF0157 family)